MSRPLHPASPSLDASLAFDFNSTNTDTAMTDVQGADGFRTHILDRRKSTEPESRGCLAKLEFERSLSAPPYCVTGSSSWQNTDPACAGEIVPLDPPEVEMCSPADPTEVEMYSPTDPIEVKMCSPRDPTEVEIYSPTDPTEVEMYSPTDPTEVEMYTQKDEDFVDYDPFYETMKVNAANPRQI